MMWWLSDDERRDLPTEQHRLLQPHTEGSSQSILLSSGARTYGGAGSVVVVQQELPDAGNPSLMETTTTTTDGNINDILTATPSQKHLSFVHMVALLSTAFAYGCIFTTLFVITLPIECERIQQQQLQLAIDSSSTPVSAHLLSSKSILLGIFVAIAGFTQLISPFIGYLSDSYIPPQLTQQTIDNPPSMTATTTLQIPSLSLIPQYAEVGQRLPYYIVGAMFATTGLMGQMFTSYSAWWIHYSFAFVFSMIGLNIQYAMMLALLPDQIPSEQIGIANGILAFLLVTGSIFGFTLFHVLLYQDSIQSMYGLYASIVILTSIFTSLYAHERDAEMSAQRLQLLHRHTQQSVSVNVESNYIPTRNHLVPHDTNRKHDDVKVEPLSNGRAKLWHVRQAGAVTKKVVRGAVEKAQQIVVAPTLLLRSMIAPIHRLNYSTLLLCYTIDIHTNYNFLIVTLSRLFYYCGMSIQTFFLYYIHDVIEIPPHQNPETIVAILAMIGQCSGALTCYPVGVLSDRLLHGQRKPFIYMACIILAAATFSFIYARTVHHMILICIILGAANGMYLTAETSLAVDTLTTDKAANQNIQDNTSETEESSQKDHDAGSAQLLGIWGVAAFVGSALGPLIGGPLLEAFGSTTTTSSTILHHTAITTTSTAYTIFGYTVILSLSSFYFICSAVTLLFIKVDKPVCI